MTNSIETIKIGDLYTELGSGHTGIARAVEYDEDGNARVRLEFQVDASAVSDAWFAVTDVEIYTTSGESAEPTTTPDAVAPEQSTPATPETSAPTA